MNRCPDCKYTTQSGHHMETHKQNTGHGQERKVIAYKTLGNGMTARDGRHKGPKADQLAKKQAQKRRKAAARAAKT